MPNLKVSEQAYPTTRYTEAAAPSTPAAGEVVIYAKADGNLYQKDDAGTETLLANVSAGAVATDAIWDAKGDLAAGTGANTASKLTVGANDTILMADSAQSTGLKWVASQTPSTQAYSDAAAEGTADTYARGDHKHGMPAAGAGSIVWLARQTASSSAALDFATVVSSTYDNYIVKFVGLEPQTNSTDLYMRVSTDGSTFLTTSVYTEDHFLFRTGASATGGSATAHGFIGLTKPDGSHVATGTAGEMINGTLNIYLPTSSTQFTVVEGEFMYRDTTPARVKTIMRGAYEATTDITGFRFLMSSGNIVTGTVDVFGVKHA